MFHSEFEKKNWIVEYIKNGKEKNRSNKYSRYQLEKFVFNIEIFFFFFSIHYFIILHKHSNINKNEKDSKDDWLSEAYDLAKKLARDCQEIIGGAFHNESKNIEFKGSVDLVTATDKAVEKLIFSKIKEVRIKWINLK